MLRGGQVMDVITGDVAPADVLIDSERIAAVGRSHEFGSDNGATAIDVTGLTIMPGLANNHVHLGWDGLGWDGGPFGTLRDQGVNDSRAVTALKSAVNLKKSLSVGLTAIRDLGMNLSNIDAAEGMSRDIIAGPGSTTPVGPSCAPEATPGGAAEKRTGWTRSDRRYGSRSKPAPAGSRSWPASGCPSTPPMSSRR